MVPEPILAALLLPFAGYIAYVAIRVGSKIREPRRQRKLVWSTCVLGFLALAALLFGLNDFVHSFRYLLGTQIMWGISCMLIATIPCSVAFCNRKYIRPFRNLFFLALGAEFIWLAIRWL